MIVLHSISSAPRNSTPRNFASENCGGGAGPIFPGVVDFLQNRQKVRFSCGVVLYSIPLNDDSEPRGCRMVQKSRMDMIETVLERSWSRLSENIYIMGAISGWFL